MALNSKFGRLVDGALELAPMSKQIDGILYSRLSDEQYLALDYKHVIDKPLMPKADYEVVFTGYNESETTIELQYEYVEIPAQSCPLSKLRVHIALTRLGLYSQFEDWLKNTTIALSEDVSMTCFEAWQNALIIDFGDPLFAPYLDQVKALFADVLTDAEMQELIETCKAD